MHLSYVLLLSALIACAAPGASTETDAQLPDAAHADASPEPIRSVAFPGAPAICDSLVGLISAQQYLRETFGNDVCLHAQCGVDGPFLYACADTSAFTVTAGFDVPENLNETCTPATAMGAPFADLVDPDPTGPHAPTAVNFPNAPQICDAIALPDTLDPPFTHTAWLLATVGCDACVHAQCGNDDAAATSTWACAGCSTWGSNSGRGLDRLVCAGY